MKQMTCAQMGGPCNAVITGSTAEEMAKNGGAHVMSMNDDAHKPTQQMMQELTPEDNAKWMADLKVKFDALPEK